MVLISIVFGIIYNVCQVSVPLRGLWFLSRRHYIYISVMYVVVSVPLRGLWFLSYAAVRRIIGSIAWFPSPCGDYGSYLLKIGFLIQ